MLQKLNPNYKDKKLSVNKKTEMSFMECSDGKINTEWVI